MTAKDAVKRLLAQTGLGFTVTSTGAVQISGLSARDQALRAQAAIPLDTINVEGGNTEGAHPFGYGPGSGDRTSNPQQVISSSKTGTKLADIPGSVQTVPHELLYEQGATMLRQSLDNASGVNFGGQDSKGFYDHFLIRGLNAQIYEDGFSDGDQLGGVSHSLNGVDHIEVVEGPGSALFGSGPPGGTINIVHYKPSSDLHYGASVQAGSFGTIVNNDYITGPTTLPGLSYRIDGTFSHTDGFRDLAGHDYEILPQLQYQWAGPHDKSRRRHKTDRRDAQLVRHHLFQRDAAQKRLDQFEIFDPIRPLSGNLCSAHADGSVERQRSAHDQQSVLLPASNARRSRKRRQHEHEGERRRGGRAAAPPAGRQSWGFRLPVRASLALHDRPRLAFARDRFRVLEPESRHQPVNG